MITFKPTMDKHSLDIRVNDEHVGYLLWGDSNPRLVIPDTFYSVSLELLQRSVKILEFKKGHGYQSGVKDLSDAGLI